MLIAVIKKWKEFNKMYCKIKRFPNKARFMLERAVCDTEQGDTEPGTVFVFTL